jgi:hypothetical protein
MLRLDVVFKGIGFAIQKGSNAAQLVAHLSFIQE